MLATIVALAFIGRLDHPDYRTRVRAQASLREMGAAADLAIEAAWHSRSLEARKRVRDLRPLWEWYRANRIAYSFGKMPMLHQGIVGSGAYDHYMRIGELSEEERTGEDPWFDCRKATRAWLIGQLYQGRPLEAIRRDLRYLWELDTLYWR